jgi:ABC-type transporter Mla MlaB component
LNVDLPALIDERFEFSKLVPALPTEELKVSCKQVRRINSMGLRNLLKFVNQVRSSKIKLSFIEVTPPLVEQASMLRNLLTSTEVESMLLPYYCENCDETQLKLSSTKGLSQNAIQAEIANTVICQGCQMQTKFDAVVEHYVKLAGAQP